MAQSSRSIHIDHPAKPMAMPIPAGAICKLPAVPEGTLDPFRSVEASVPPASAEPRYYWDTEAVTEFETPYGSSTARIIDNEAGGAISYVHVDNADFFVKLLTASPLPAS